MHEASLAQSVLDIIVRNCASAGAEKILSVRLEIGKASGVMPEALKFAFDAMKAETPAEDAEMTISVIPVGGACSGCGGEFEADSRYVFSCPLCGSEGISITKGRELSVVDIEVE